MIDTILKQGKSGQFDPSPFQDMDLNVKHTSVCAQPFGMIKYLAMCGKMDDYMAFFNDCKFGNTESKQVFDNFIHDNKSKFSILFAFIGLSQYVLDGARVHYFCVIKLNGKYSVVQSFGLYFSLKQAVSDKYWMDEQEIVAILNGFIELESFRMIDPFTEKDAHTIKEKSNLCLGFELLPDYNPPKRSEEQEMKAVILKDLSFVGFMNGAKHLLQFIDYLFMKFKKREFGSIMHHAPLRFRIGFPFCL